MNWDREKTIDVVLYIAKDLQQADLHKVFKILYFAEMRHLETYGRPIIYDRYIAMKNGPVPSKTYDTLKAVRDPYLEVPYENEIRKKLDIYGYHLDIKAEPNLDNISDSEKMCLDTSINENKDLSFIDLTNKSHGPAYQKADPNNEIDTLEIAIEGGASQGMISYIQELEEVQKALQCL